MGPICVEDTTHHRWGAGVDEERRRRLSKRTKEVKFHQMCGHHWRADFRARRKKSEEEGEGGVAPTSSDSLPAVLPTATLSTAPNLRPPLLLPSLALPCPFLHEHCTGPPSGEGCCRMISHWAD